MSEQEITLGVNDILTVRTPHGTIELMPCEDDRTFIQIMKKNATQYVLQKANAKLGTGPVVVNLEITHKDRAAGTIIC